MKQRFKGEVLTTTKVVNNILSIYDQCTSTTYWYQEANTYAKYLADQFNMHGDNDVSRVCGIISALSPLKSWDENKRIAYQFLQSGNGKHTKVFKGKAKDILESDGKLETIADILNGNKITSFYLNILEPDNDIPVTIDRHALSIAMDRSLSAQMTFNQYMFFANCYRIASKKRGIIPSLMQSTTWVKWRELKKDKFEDVPF